MAVPGQALADHRAGEHVQRGEQGGGAVALVVVGHRAGPARLHRQRRLGAVQRLDLGLLVHAQHDRLLRRVQVQPDDVDELLLEPRVVGELERLDPVRLQTRAPTRSAAPWPADTPTRAAIVRHSSASRRALQGCRLRIAATFTRGHIFVGMKTKYLRITKTSNAFTFVFCAYRMRRIFEYAQSTLFSDLKQLIGTVA